jgi:hypothetical protein
MACNHYNISKRESREIERERERAEMRKWKTLHLGGGGGGEHFYFFEGSQTVPARPSGRDTVDRE